MSPSDQSNLAALSRKDAPAASVRQPTSSEVERVAKRAHEANQAFISGDMERWYALIGPIPDDFTLMQPIGGPVSRGFDASPAHLAELASFFRKGDATQELLASYASPEMMVLVLIERQRGEGGDLPMQDWSLRVTLVFRREGERWTLVHRHADPLVREISLKTSAELAAAPGTPSE